MTGSEHMEPSEKVIRAKLERCMGKEGWHHDWHGLNQHVKEWWHVCGRCGVSRIKSLSGWLYRRDPMGFREDGIII